MDYTKIPSPCYVLEEEKLRKNLKLIRSVKERAGVEIIMAFKAFAMWSAFPIVKEYIKYTTASSLGEARLAYEEMGTKAHTYAPVYREDEFETIADCSSHITFNSVAQFEKYRARAVAKGISCGLRSAKINPPHAHHGKWTAPQQVQREHPKRTNAFGSFLRVMRVVRFGREFVSGYV